MKPSLNIFDLIFGLVVITALVLDRYLFIEKHIMSALFLVYLAGKYSDYIGEKILKWAKRK